MIETFYIKFYNIVFEIHAEKKLFERSFGDLISDECTTPPDYHLVFCGYLNKENLYPLCQGNISYNYMGTPYYTYYASTKERILISINCENGDHLFKCRGTSIDVFNFEKKQNSIWVVRLCQDLIVSEMVKKGFIPVHAAAVARNNKGILIFGNKRAGKSTTMLSLVQQGFNVMSNDLCFLKHTLEDEWIVVGWPWKVTIGNSLLEKTPYRDIIDYQREKTQFYPQEFCNTFGCSWVWTSQLVALIHPNVQINEPLRICKIPKEDILQVLLNTAIEHPHINCVIAGSCMYPTYLETFKHIANNFDILSVCGDIWGQQSQLFKHIEREFY